MAPRVWEWFSRGLTRGVHFIEAQPPPPPHPPAAAHMGLATPAALPSLRQGSGRRAASTLPNQRGLARGGDRWPTCCQASQIVSVPACSSAGCEAPADFSHLADSRNHGCNWCQRSRAEKLWRRSPHSHSWCSDRIRLGSLVSAFALDTHNSSLVRVCSFEQNKR